MSEYEGPSHTAARSHQHERACASLLGVIAGITADGELHDLEIQFLRTWLAQNRKLNHHWLGNQIAAQLDAILADGHVSEDERAQLLLVLQGTAGQQFAETGCAEAETIAFPADECEVTLQGATVCLTGKFHFGTRSECEAATGAAGATCVDSVTRKVQYLVIGEAGATASWKQATYGAKIDAALKLKERGHRIYVVGEQPWRTALAV